ncbi:holo-ACP synthase [Humibacter soli]
MRVGIDAEPVSSVYRALEEFGDRYRRRIYTSVEIDACGGPDARPEDAAEGLAARFAAKEATLKVLRVGDRVPPWTDIEVVHRPDGSPSLRLRGVAAELAEEASLTAFDVSLTHTAELAIAVVISAE